MGASNSLVHSGEDDDILGSDFNRTSRGVIKRIPIEIKPRGKLGLRSVGSSGRKPKGDSLRSALSVDLENAEVEKIKKDFDMYRLNKENDICNMRKKAQKLEGENKRLKSELLALRNTCSRMREERHAALEAEREAVARAGSFELDRDKIQRQFKLFRETKEGEFQHLLRKKRESENHLSKLLIGLPESLHNSTMSDFGDLGNCNEYDSSTTPERETSFSRTEQSSFQQAPMLMSTVIQMDGPFNNVTKEDWFAASTRIINCSSSVPEYAVSNTLRIYILSTPDVISDVELFIKDYLMTKLRNFCLSMGRELVVTYLSSLFDEQCSADMCQKVRNRQIEMCSLFLCILGHSCHKFVASDIEHGYFNNQGWRPTLCCFLNNGGDIDLPLDMQDIYSQIRNTGFGEILDVVKLCSQTMDSVYSGVKKIFTNELGLGNQEGEVTEIHLLDEGFYFSSDRCGVMVWDDLCHLQQLESLICSLNVNCAIGLDKLCDRLTAHVSTPGPAPPLLVSGSSGSGRSFLLASWIRLQEEKSSGKLVLYHFVGSTSSLSADPIIMIHRLTSQLMKYLNAPMAATCNPERLTEEFPIWLEKISTKFPAGIIFVLDSADRFPEAEVYLKWLLDPLPVNVHIIVSVHDDTSSSPWRSWPTLQLMCLGTKNIRQLLRSEFTMGDFVVDEEVESSVLTHCRSLATSSPLYIRVMARHLVGLQNSGVRRNMDKVLCTSDTQSLYCCVLEYICEKLGHQGCRTHFFQILRYLCSSRGGMHENELLDLIPRMSCDFLCHITHLLEAHFVVNFHSGVFTFAHQDAEIATRKFCFGNGGCSTVNEVRQLLVDYFSHMMCKDINLSWRVPVELPWLLASLGKNDELKSCILNLTVFQLMYAKGQCAELLSYWRLVGGDKLSMADEYFTAVRMMEEDGLVTLLRVAETYETLGLFLKDLGLFSKALPALQRALEAFEAALDPDHPAVAHCLHHLAELHTHWHKFSTAALLFWQSLDILENAYGTEHHLVARELECLAFLCRKQNKHDSAESFRKKAMSIRKGCNLQKQSTLAQLKGDVIQLEELAIGRDSPDLARILNELGVLYFLQNNIKASESLFKHSLNIRESLLGTEHLDVAQSLNNLAGLYTDHKQYEKAESLYERALEIRYKHTSPDSAGVAAIIKHLIVVYRNLGRYEKAELLYSRMAAMLEKIFGSDNLSLASTHVGLAMLYCQQSKYSDAEPLYERALTVFEDNFGFNHPIVAEIIHNLAVLSYQQKNYMAASQYYSRVLDMKQSDVAQR